MTKISDADRQLLELIGDRKVTVSQLIDDGACMTIAADANSLRYRLNKLADEGLVRKIKLKVPPRTYAGRYPSHAFEVMTEGGTMTVREAGIYNAGREAQRIGQDKEPPSELSKVDKAWWLAGFNDADTEEMTP